MTIKPMLFSGPMVRALLNGRKTMTRRVLKDQPGDLDRPFQMDDGSWHVTDSQGENMSPLRVPYAVGDVLWVRETWKPIPDKRPGGYFVPGSHFYGRESYYHADHDCPLWANGPWKPSIHMPRRLSRLTLEVTDVRVERVQDISEEDAKAEGAEQCARRAVGLDGGCPSYRCGFQQLWQSINKSRGYGWEANPWCAAISFRVHRRNVDSFGPDPDLQRLNRSA